MTIICHLIESFSIHNRFINVAYLAIDYAAGGVAVAGWVGTVTDKSSVEAVLELSVVGG